MIEFLVFILSLVLIISKKKEAILFYPIISTCYDITRGYFEHNFFTENYRFIFLIILFIFHFRHVRFFHAKSIVIFIFYLVILLFLNLFDDSWRPAQITSVFNVSSILLMFFIGYDYIDSLRKLKKLYVILIFNSLIIFCYFFIIQFEILDPLRADGTYSIGGFVAHHFDYDIYTVCVSLLFFVFCNLFLKSSKNSLINNFFIASSIILIVLFMKRWAILCTTIAFVVLKFYSIKKIKINISLFLMVLLSVFVFKDNILNQFEGRGEKVNSIQSIEQEGRFFDYIYMYDYFTTNKSFRELTIGTNLFESRDFGQKYFNELRNIHPDLLALLYGTGIIGLLLYLNIYLSLLKSIKKIYYNLKVSNINQEFKSFYYSLLIFMFIASIGGGALRVTTANSIVFLLIGGIQKIISKENFLSMKIKNNKNEKN